MLRKTLLHTVFVFAFFGLTSSIANAQPAGSVSGKWRITAVVPKGQDFAGTYTGSLDLTERNGVVTGTGIAANLENSTVTGTIRNGEIVLNMLHTSGFRGTYRGRVTANGRMEGTSANDPSSPGGNAATATWTATRLSASHPFLNGNFEDGPAPGSFLTLGSGSKDINGWMVTKGTIDYIGTIWKCPCGQRCIDLDGTPGPGAINQTFSTVPGRQYYVSFTLWGNFDCDRGMKTVLVKAAGQRATFNFDTSNRPPWVTRNLSFTANSGSTTIEFESLDGAGNCGPVIDNVQVTTAVAPEGCPGVVTTPLATAIPGSYSLKAEWRSSLAMNVKLLLTALGERGAGARITTQMWGPVKTKTVSSRDRLRFTLKPDNPDDPKHPLTVEVRYRGQTWRRVANGTVGTPIEVALPVEKGDFEVEIVIHPRNKPIFRTGSQSFTVQPSDCGDFYNRVLILIAEAVFQYRQTAGTKTYQEAWAAGEKPADPLLMKVDASTRLPYLIKTGDVVLRSGGRTSSVMGSLGAPDSPQTHAAIAVVRSINGQRLVTVRQVSLDNYTEIPLSVADAKILEKIDSLAARPVSFVEGSNVGSVEIYRPIGTILNRFGAFPYDAIGQEAAIRAKRIGENVTGYDYAFMEQGSSTLAGSEKFKNLYYCNEFVRDSFGVSLAAADEKKVIKDFWQAAFRCDAESGAARGRRSTPSSLISALEEIPWDDITFNAADKQADTKARDSIKAVIATLKDLSRGTTIRQLLTQNVRTAVSEELRKKLPGFAPAVYDLALMMVQPETRAWLVLSEGAITQGIASNLVDEMINDLGNAVGTRQLLDGGIVKSAQGDNVRVSFVRIN